MQEIRDSLNEDVQKYKSLQEKLPFISGNQVIFSNMPDWNPAEIIGTRPKPLSLSLYQELITNNIWAKQRAEFGYKDVRPYPLIYSFSSQPYVDVRASFNSFIPSSVPDSSADRIVNAYLKILCDKPYLYDKVEFDVLVGTYGDCFDRFAIRLNEIRESIRIVKQILEKIPQGDYKIQDKKVTPPPRARIDESMEALIHHFKIFTEGFKVPAGEVYASVESPRGELGCYIVSDGGPKPYRMHIRGPSFTNLQVLPHMLQNCLVADAVAVISTVDPIMGEVDR